MPEPTQAELLAELAALRQETEALRRRQGELTALLAAHQAITSSLDLDQSLHAIVGQAATIAGEVEVWLYLLDEEKTTLRCRVAIGLSPEEIASIRIPVGQSFSGHVALTGEPLMVADIRGDPRDTRPDLSAKHHRVSYLGIPVKSQDRVFGVLGFSGSQPRTYSPEEVRLLAALATQAAIAIKNTSLYEATQRELHERTRAERALRESEERYRRITVTMTDYIFRVRVVDGHPAETFQGPGCVAVTGYDPEEFTADPALWMRIVDAADRPAVLEQARQVLAGREAKPLEHRIMRKDGALRWVRNTPVPHRDPQGTLVAYDGLIQDITERKSAEEALAEHAHRLEVVRALTTELTRGLDLSSLLDRIIRYAVDLAGGASGGMTLLDEATGLLVPQAWFGHPDWFGQMRWRLGEGVVGRVAQRRQGEIVNDYRASPHALPTFLEETRISAVLVEPLLYHDRLLGVIAIDREPSDPPFTPHDRDTLALFSTQAAIAIENARSHEAAVRRGEQLEALLRASRTVMAGLDLQEILDRILAEAARISGAPHVKVLLLDKEAGVLRVGALKGSAMPPGFSLPLGVGSSGIVAQTGEPLFMADAQNDPRSIFAQGDRELGIVTYLGLPIRRGNEILGVLTFNTTVPRQYTPEEMAYLTSFADQAAIAIENARLYDAAQRELRDRTRAEGTLLLRTQQLEAVRAVSEEITRELDLRSLLDLIMYRAAELVGATSGMVRLWDEDSGLLIPQSWIGEEVSEGRDALTLRLGEGVVGAAAARRCGLIVNDFRSSEYATPLLLERTTHAAVLAEPLLYRERLVGALSVTRAADRGPFSEEDQETLALFASQAAIAIENARLHGAAVRRGRELEALLRASQTVMSELDLQVILDRIVEVAMEITSCSQVKLLLVDEAARVLRVGAVKGATLPEGFQLPLGKGPSGRVATTGQPLFMADPASDPENSLADMNRAMGITTYLGLPVKSGERILGVLTFNTTTPHQYTADELAYLKSFADHAALAIEKAQLFAQLQQSYQDLKRTQDESIRAEKLRALGQMAAGIAHDLNNMLAAVLAQVELLRLRVADPAIQETLATLEMAIGDGAHIVHRLQDFALQRPHSPLEPVDLIRVVRETLEITRPHWKDEPHQRGQAIRLQTLLARVPLILGHAAEVREALTNLILNAVDAMPQGGTLTIATRGVPASGSGEQGSNGSGGTGVELSVTDTGVGMTEEVRQRIFDPFFTTKGGRGTGLGLSVVYGVLERHGGAIDVRSAPGQGTTISLRFRAAPRGSAPAERRPLAAPGRPRRILLVDDDPMVRLAIGSLLTAAGHTVVEAEDGATALSLLQADSVDLVLTDLGMPGLSGWDVARAVKAQSVRLPVVILTGWGEQASVEAEGSGLVDRILGKPVRLEQLLRTIAELTPDA
jgi:PAS domain S-box-containing protein